MNQCQDPKTYPLGIQKSQKSMLQKAFAGELVLSEVEK